MFVALDEKNCRHYASENLDRKRKYFCPCCGGEVRLRVGETNVPHFSHISLSQCDDFSNDMSEWHRQWQLLFPEKNREVIIEKNGERHRADVRCYGTVIEFQHSPISKEEFNRRNEFYTSFPEELYVVWIFDVREISEINMEITKEEGSETTYKWNWPFRFLSDFYPQSERKVTVFFQTGDFDSDPKSAESSAYMEKVTWAAPAKSNYRNNNTPWYRFKTTYDIGNYYDLMEWLKKRCK